VIKELWEVEIAHSIERVVPLMLRGHSLSSVGPTTATCDRLRVQSRQAPFHDAVLGFLADIIDKDRLQMVPRGRGHPKMPETFARDLVAASAYGVKDKGKGSDPAIDRIAAVMGISSQIVQQAINRLSKHNNKQR
jgi:hypothetical protein